jgi:beta-xylosidase
VKRLVGYAKVDLEPAAAVRVVLRLPTDLASFTGLDGRRVLEPGDLDLHLAASSADSRAVLRVRLTGAARHYSDVEDAARLLTSETETIPLP